MYGFFLILSLMWFFSLSFNIGELNDVYFQNLEYIKEDKLYKFDESLLTGCNKIANNGLSYTGGCYTKDNTEVFIPYKSGLNISINGERIEDGVVWNWWYGSLGCATFSGGNILNQCP